MAIRDEFQAAVNNAPARHPTPPPRPGG